jgi:hypothetical protein
MMLFVLVTLCVGVLSHATNMCPTAGKKPLINMGVNNYVIDWLEIISGYFIPFPFAIGQCTSHSLVSSTKYYTHFCANGMIATQAFRDFNCTNPKGLPVLSQTVSKYDAGEVGFFECGGEDTYAELWAASNLTTADSACATLQHLYVGLKGCVDETEVLGKTMSVYCDPTQTIFKWFLETEPVFNSTTAMPVATTLFPVTTVPLMQTTPIAPFNLSTKFPQVNSSHLPTSTMMPFGMCDAKGYCFDWDIYSFTPCQQIVVLQGSDIAIWGKMGSCREYVSAGVRSSLALWTVMMVAIFGTLMH